MNRRNFLTALIGTPALAAFLVQRKDSPQRFAALLRRHLAKPLACVRWPADTPDAAPAGTDEPP